MIPKTIVSSSVDKTSQQGLNILEMRSLGADHKAAAHVLAIPFPSHGHITPMLRFTHQLARMGMTVSFVCYEDSIPCLTSSADDASSEARSLDFRFVTLQRPRADQMDWKHVTSAVFEEMIFKEAFEPLMEKLTLDKSAGIAGPTCVIADAFVPWTLDVAEKLRIPRYTLIASGVTYARLMQVCIDYFDLGQFQSSKTDGKLVEFDWPVCISGLPPLRYHELNYNLRHGPAYFREKAEAMMQSTGLIVNSFFELEEKVVEAFRSPRHPGDEHIKVPKIYPVGPLFSTTVLTDSTNVNGLEDSSSKCLLWLGSQPSSSVLYVAFGSEARLGPEQINELAHGLEASNQRFLWVIPQSRDKSEQETHSITEVLPPGFQERVGDLGCIVSGWAPQLQILAHASTGGFLTHTGWNSSLESVIFGVPMICWPQKAEQHLNCRYLVDELKVAEQLQTGRENILKRSEVERAVHLLMVEPEGTAMRSTVGELRRKAAAALAKGGSQSRFFQEFLDDIRNHEVSRAPDSNIEKRLLSVLNHEVVAKDGPRQLNYLVEREDQLVV